MIRSSKSAGGCKLELLREEEVVVVEVVVHMLGVCPKCQITIGLRHDLISHVPFKLLLGPLTVLLYLSVPQCQLRWLEAYYFVEICVLGFYIC